MPLVKENFLGIRLGNHLLKWVKNDISIAATAKVAGAKLLTIDGDFDHLAGRFIEVVKYK